MTFNPELEEPVRIENDNQQEPRVSNRGNDTRSEESDPSDISVTLYTVDNAIIKFLSDRIKPIVTQGGTQIVVPVMYGSPERWKSVQRDGILRDSMGKIQLPMLMLRRTSMKKTLINSPVNKYYERTFSTGWNRRTPYDRYAAINGVTPNREYYVTTAVPDYYEFSYRGVIWTEYMEQMNRIVENISFESDEFWGEPNSYKFRTIIKSFEMINEVPSTLDRVVRTQFDMTVYGYLLPETQLDKGLARGFVNRKQYGVKKIVTFTEVSGQ
jgi:hypothetical protein